MKGLELLHSIVAATGLPEDGVEKELASVLSAAGKNKEDITLDDLREVLASYLQEVLLSAKDELS
jgi:hypothetical protein